MKAIGKRERAIASGLAAVAVLPIFLGETARAANWQVELVDQTGVAKFSSLEIDQEGNVHVAYVVDDGNRYPLKYAFWDHLLNRWFTMTVAEGVSFPSLALDSKQHPHISYADYGAGSGTKLRYAYWDGATWKKEAIPLDSEVIAYYTSLVLDANDNPGISFYEYRGPKGSGLQIRLRVVSWNGKYWEARTIDGEEGSGKFNSMAIDSQGHLRIAYANVSAGTAGMRYAYSTGDSWKLEKVDGMEQNNGGVVGFSVCLALDKEGIPRVVYTNVSTPLVKYAVRKDGRWQIQQVDALSAVAYPDRNSLALDSDGRPYVGYYDSGQGVLKVAHQAGNKWITEIIDSNFSGYTSSLGIDRGTIWISYADEANGGLKVAHRELGAGDIAPASVAGKDSGTNLPAAQTPSKGMEPEGTKGPAEH